MQGNCPKSGGSALGKEKAKLVQVRVVKSAKSYKWWRFQLGRLVEIEPPGALVLLHFAEYTLPWSPSVYGYFREGGFGFSCDAFSPQDLRLRS
jgi:hypothetical protein